MKNGQQNAFLSLGPRKVKQRLKSQSLICIYCFGKRTVRVGKCCSGFDGNQFQRTLQFVCGNLSYLKQERLKLFWSLANILDSCLTCFNPRHNRQRKIIQTSPIHRENGFNPSVSSIIKHNDNKNVPVPCLCA